MRLKYTVILEVLLLLIGLGVSCTFIVAPPLRVDQRVQGPRTLLLISPERKILIENAIGGTRPVPLEIRDNWGPPVP
jgi:hypothetical protein